MPISPEILEKLRTWLAREGYPFQLQVGRELSARAWHVTYEHVYVDLETQKPRARDIYAIDTQYVSEP